MDSMLLDKVGIASTALRLAWDAAGRVETMEMSESVAIEIDVMRANVAFALEKVEEVEKIGRSRYRCGRDICPSCKEPCGVDSVDKSVCCGARMFDKGWMK